MKEVEQAEEEEKEGKDDHGEKEDEDEREEEEKERTMMRRVRRAVLAQGQSPLRAGRALRARPSAGPQDGGRDGRERFGELP